MCNRAVSVAILAAAVIVAAGAIASRWASGREGYLIAPYLDLDEPGERGSYNAMLERPPCMGARHA